MAARPRALHLSPCMPAVSGNGLAMRQGAFLEALSRDFDVDLVVLPVAGALDTGSELPDRLGVAWQGIHLAGRRDTHFELLMQLHDADLRRTAFRGYGRSSLAAAISVPVVAEFRQRLEGQTYDLVHIGRSYLADALAAIETPGVVTIDLDEDEYTSYREIAAILVADDPAAAEWAEAEGEALDRLIALRAGAAERVFIASATDAASLLGRHPALRLEVAGNAVAVPEVHRDDAGATAIFVGSFGYLPNRDAAQWLTASIWPKVRRQVPEARLLIAGRGSETLPGNETNGVEILGAFDDIAAVYARANIALAPLRAGSGTRIKLMEAAAHRVPMIATSLAARGLDFTDPRDLWIADDAEAFAAAVVSALGSPVERRSRAANALALARDTYDRGRLVADLACRFAALVAR